MAKYASMVKETTTTTGTGNLSLDGPVSGYRDFLAPANILDQDYVPYFLLDANGAWEEGYGKVIAGAPDQLERGFVMDSSAGGAAIVLSAGTHTVGIGPIAASRRSHKVLVEKTANMTLGSGIPAAISWDQASFDTDNMWSGGDPTKLLVPPWASTVVVAGSVQFTGNSNNGRRLSILTNKANKLAIPSCLYQARWTSENLIRSDEIDVSPNDYFQLQVWQDSGSNKDLTVGNHVWFAMRIIS